MGLYAGHRPTGVNLAATAETMRLVELPWMGAIVQIVDPKIGDETYDPWANEETLGAVTVLWQGYARVQPIRNAQPLAGYFERSTVHGIRFKIPMGASITDDQPIREGLHVRVVDGGEDSSLTHFTYIIMAAVNGSLAWNRTIEAVVDLGAPITPGTPLEPGAGFGQDGYGL